MGFLTLAVGWFPLAAVMVGIVTIVTTGVRAESAIESDNSSRLGAVQIDLVSSCLPAFVTGAYVIFNSLSPISIVRLILAGVLIIASALEVAIFLPKISKRRKYLNSPEGKREKRSEKRDAKRTAVLDKLDDKRADMELQSELTGLKNKQKIDNMAGQIELAKATAELKAIKNADKKTAADKLDERLQAMEMRSRLSHAKNQQALEDMEVSNQVRAGKSKKKIIDAQYKVLEADAKGDLAEAKANASMKRATGVITGAASTGMILGGAAGGIVGGVAAGKEVGHQVGVAKASQMQAKALEDKNKVLNGANLTDEQTAMIADTEARNYQSAKGFQNKVDEGIQRALSMGFEAARQKAIAMGIGSSEMTDEEIAHKVLEFSSPVQVESLPDGLTEEQQAQCILCG